MIRVAMLSYWHVHAWDYTRQAQSHPDVTIGAVWDELPERGRAAAEQLGVPFYESLDDLLALPEIDAVIVDAPTSMHRDVMVAAARAGKHIFTEKVLAPTLAEAHQRSWSFLYSCSEMWLVYSRTKCAACQPCWRLSQRPCANAVPASDRQPAARRESRHPPDTAQVPRDRG